MNTDGPKDGNKNKRPVIILREIHNPDVSRISDHVMLINNRTTINIECKLDDIGGVIKQAKSHLKWCDYSIICMPPDRTYIPSYYFANIIELGIGFWWWFNEAGLYEMIKPKFNRKKIKIFRERAIGRIKVAATENVEIFKENNAG